MAKELIVKDFMTKKVICTNKSATIQEISVLMRENKVGTILIVDDEKLEGIVTERDIINKVVTRNLNSSEILAKDIMTMDLIRGHSLMTDVQVAQVFAENNIKKLPILEKGKIIGIVTQTDLLKVSSVKWAF